MNIQAAERLRIDQHLRGALDQGELSLVYQPIVATADRSLKGMEALIRWNNPVLGRVSPEVFIPITEQIGVIAEIGHWVLTEACAQLHHWQTQKDAGVQLALDDFGTGYSSLSYLRHLPFTVRKIDKTFINEVSRRRQEEAMVGAMVKMGHSLGMVVVAEGVETAAQTHCLEALEVDCIQGYYFSQPLSLREFENRFLSKGRATGVALDASVWDRL